MTELRALWHRNPLLVQLLGLSPLLAITHTATTGLMLGILTAVVGFLAILINHQLSYVKLQWWRFCWFVFLLASLTSACSVILQRYFFELSQELGIYLPLISCNLALLLAIEEFSSNKKHFPLSKLVGESASYCAAIAVGFLIFSVLREMLVFGSFFRDLNLLFNSENVIIDSAQFSRSEQYFHFFKLQPGAMILLGVTLAITNWIRIAFYKPKIKPASEVNKVARARVTGRL